MYFLGNLGFGLLKSQIESIDQTVAATSTVNNRFVSVLASDPDLNVAMQQVPILIALTIK